MENLKPLNLLLFFIHNNSNVSIDNHSFLTTKPYLKLLLHGNDLSLISLCFGFVRVPTRTRVFFQNPFFPFNSVSLFFLSRLTALIGSAGAAQFHAGRMRRLVSRVLMTEIPIPNDSKI